MIPKGKLLALVLVFGAVGTLAATGAFTTVEAERTADVNVAGDANALLAIQPTENPEGSSFIQQGNTVDDQFEIVLQGNDDSGVGLNPQSTTTAQNIFNITNNGEEPVDVWINTEGGVQEDNETVNTTFYIDDNKVGDDSQVEVDGDPVKIGSRIDEFDALVDDQDDGVSDINDTDIVISEDLKPSNVEQSPNESGLAVNIAPGQSVTVSMAIEIESDANLGVTSNQTVLENITVLAVNDGEEGNPTVDEGTQTAARESGSGS